MVLQHAPGAVVHEIPHLFEPPPEFPAASEVLRLRHELDLTPRVFLFGVFGHLRESKRLLSVLRAFERVRRDVPRWRCWWRATSYPPTSSAPPSRSSAPAAESCESDYLPEPDFWRYASAADACINLRYPAAGETSGISIRLMGAAKPVLMTAGLETSRFPESACIRWTQESPKRTCWPNTCCGWPASPADARDDRRTRRVSHPRIPRPRARGGDLLAGAGRAVIIRIKSESQYLRVENRFMASGHAGVLRPASLATRHDGARKV